MCRIDECRDQACTSLVQYILLAQSEPTLPISSLFRLYLNIFAAFVIKVIRSLRLRSILYLLRVSMILVILSCPLSVFAIQTLWCTIFVQTINLLPSFPHSVHLFMSDCGRMFSAILPNLLSPNSIYSLASLIARKTYRALP